MIENETDRTDCARRIMDWFYASESVDLSPSYQDFWGTPGSYVWYNLTVMNLGFGMADSFDLTNSSPLGWTYDYFESDLVTPLIDTNGNTIPDTGDMGAIWGTKDIAVRVTIPPGAQDGDQDTTYIIATSYNNGNVNSTVIVDTYCYGPGEDYKAVYISYQPEADWGPYDIIWGDDFETGVLDPLNWSTTNPMYSGVSNQTSQSGYYSMYVSTDYLEVLTNTFDLSDKANVNFNCWIRKGSDEFSEFPDYWPIYLWYLNADNEWVSFFLWAGGGPVSEAGAIYELNYTFPQDAAHTNFQMIVQNYHGNPVTPYTDYWHLDDFQITERLRQDQSDLLLYNAANWTSNVTGDKTIAILDSWGTQFPSTWQNWSNELPDVEVVFVNGEITYDKLVLSKSDAIIISHAYYREYTDDEIAAIDRYASEGHGLIATGGSMDIGVPNNQKLGSLFGLAEGLQAWPSGFANYSIDAPLHPVMNGLSDPITPGIALESCTGMVLDGAISLAHIDTFQTGMITAYERDTIPPTFAGLQTCDPGALDGEIDLGWNPATDIHTPITYNIYQATASGGQNFDVPTFSTSSTSHTVSGLVNGNTYYYVVRAEDAYGNEDDNTVERSATAPGSPPPVDSNGPATTNVIAAPNPTNGVDLVVLTADVSDLGLGDNNIIAAECFIDAVGADGSGIGMAAVDGAYDSVDEAVTQSVDISALDDGSHTLFVHGKDAYGNWGATDSVVLDKTRMYQKILIEGWNLISIPFEPADTSIASVLTAIDGNYDCVQYYNATDSDHWKTYSPFKPPGLNDLTDIHNTMSFWVHITAPGGTVLTTYGYTPTTTSITLYPGWNMVGYPAIDDSSYTVQDLMDDTGATSIERFFPIAPYHIEALFPDHVLQVGEGYWVYAPAEVVWTVNW
jgi:hypothetical protein